MLAEHRQASIVARATAIAKRVESVEMDNRTTLGGGIATQTHEQQRPHSVAPLHTAEDFLSGIHPSSSSVQICSFLSPIEGLMGAELDDEEELEGFEESSIESDSGDTCVDISDELEFLASIDTGLDPVRMAHHDALSLDQVVSF